MRQEQYQILFETLNGYKEQDLPLMDKCHWNTEGGIESVRVYYSEKDGEGVCFEVWTTEIENEGAIEYSFTSEWHGFDPCTIEDALNCVQTSLNEYLGELEIVKDRRQAPEKIAVNGWEYEYTSQWHEIEKEFDAEQNIIERQIRHLRYAISKSEKTSS